MKELVIVLGLFMIILYAGINYVKMFGLNFNMPKEIEEGFTKSYEQIKEAQSKVQEIATTQNTTVSVPLVGDIYKALSVAFGVVNLIAISLFNIFVSIPSAFFIAMNYVASQLNIPEPIVYIFSAVLISIVVIKTIEFVTGRYIRWT